MGPVLVVSPNAGLARGLERLGVDVLQVRTTFAWRGDDLTPCAVVLDLRDPDHAAASLEHVRAVTPDIPVIVLGGGSRQWRAVAQAAGVQLVRGLPPPSALLTLLHEIVPALTRVATQDPLPSLPDNEDAEELVPTAGPSAPVEISSSLADLSDLLDGQPAAADAPPLLWHDETLTEWLTAGRDAGLVTVPRDDLIETWQDARVDIIEPPGGASGPGPDHQPDALVDGALLPEAEPRDREAPTEADRDPTLAEWLTAGRAAAPPDSVVDVSAHERYVIDLRSPSRAHNRAGAPRGLSRVRSMLASRRRTVGAGRDSAPDVREALSAQQPESVLTLSQVARAVLDEALSVCAAEAGALLVRDRGAWSVVAGRALRPREEHLSVPPDHWAVSSAIGRGLAMLVEHSDIVRQRIAGLPLASWEYLLVAPIGSRNALLILARSGSPFGEGDIRRITAIDREATLPLDAAIRMQMWLAP